MDAIETIRNVVERAGVSEAGECYYSARDDSGREYFAIRYGAQAGDPPCAESGDHFLVSVDQEDGGLWPIAESDAVDAGYLLCSAFLRRAHPLGRVIRRLN